MMLLIDEMHYSSFSLPWDIANRGCVPTFTVDSRREVFDLTLDSNKFRGWIINWQQVLQGLFTFKV